VTVLSQSHANRPHTEATQHLFTTKSKGQGFGLAVVKRMTEALGGTVTFESQQGKGTKFIIRLPTPRDKR
jgi:signal transduction histidine kinase